MRDMRYFVASNVQEFNSFMGRNLTRKIGNLINVICIAMINKKEIK